VVSVREKYFHKVKIFVSNKTMSGCGAEATVVKEEQGDAMATEVSIVDPASAAAAAAAPAPPSSPPPKRARPGRRTAPRSLLTESAAAVGGPSYSAASGSSSDGGMVPYTILFHYPSGKTHISMFNAAGVNTFNMLV